jgi:predicted helicase
VLRSSSSKQLAARLAEIAQEIREAHGDLLAQTVPYALLLRRWDPASPVGPLLDGFDDPQAISRIEAALDCPEVDTVRSQFESAGRDPAVYFYEHFLRAYDPANSRGRGVLYTPPEVVSCIVNGIDSILRDSFGQTLDDTILIDPCCGLGTFLRHIERHTSHRPHMIGMDLMPAPCAIARCLLREAQILQTNWLSETHIEAAGRTLVILGNPPYSGHSSNAGKIADLMADYREGLRERNPKWLQDDYVKFIRMAQHHIDTAGRGVVAFITNHSYLFNPTFRAMRASLAQTFDEMLILDLGGNVKRLVGADENIFPIQMGVAIAFMVKTSTKPACSIRHISIVGSREHKLRTLATSDISAIPWTDVPAAGPFHLFTPHDSRLGEEFYSFSSLFDIFGDSTIGFVTSRDKFAIGFTKDEVLSRIAALRAGSVSDAVLIEDYGVGDLDIESARRELRDDPDWQDKAVEVLYRPFDRRWAYYSRTIMERPRLPFMENLMQENIALAVGRAGQVTGSDEWDVVFCTDRPADLNLFRRGGAKLFPRYVYRNGERLSNVMLSLFQHPPEGVDFFAYIYAILHSTAYRARYAEFLRMDYPRIPITHDRRAIGALADLGSKLIEAHLMRTPCPQTHESCDSGIRIGGYELPGRYLRERARIDTAAQIATVKFLVDQTRLLREHIDRVIADAPPW